MLNANALENALKSILPVLPPRSTLDSLKCVLLESDGSRLHLTATNLKTFAKASIGHQAGAAFKAGVLPEYLEAAIACARASGGSEISISQVGDGVLELRAGSWAFNTPFSPADDTPLPPEPPETMTPVSLKLFEALGKAVVFAHSDQSRYILTGVHLDKTSSFQGKTGWVVATDARRITAVEVADVPFDGTLESSVSSLLSSAGMGASSACAGLSPDNFAVFDIATYWGNLGVSTKLLGGGLSRYPDWPRVFPEGTPENVTTWDAPKLVGELEAIGRVSPNILAKFSPEGCQAKAETSEQFWGIARAFGKWVPFSHVSWKKGKASEKLFPTAALREMCALFSDQPGLLVAENFPDINPMVVRAGGVVHALMGLRHPRRED